MGILQIFHTEHKKKTTSYLKEAMKSLPREISIGDYAKLLERNGI